MSKNIAEHPLVVDALNAIRPHLEKLDPAKISKGLLRKVRKKVDKPTRVSPRNFPYHHNVFEKVAKVVADFDTMEKIIAMVRHLPPKPILKIWKMSGDDWLRYQYTAFLVTMVGSIDRCLCVVNAVMQLGLDPRDCTDQILLRNDQLKTTAIAKAIKKLLKEMQQVRTHRNLDVHRKETQSFNDILDFDSYEMLSSLAFLETVGHELMSPNLIQTGFRLAGRQLANKMQKERTRIKTLVWRLFDRLEPVAKRKVNLYKMFNASAKNERPLVVNVKFSPSSNQDFGPTEL